MKHMQRVLLAAAPLLLGPALAEEDATTPLADNDTGTLAAFAESPTLSETELGEARAAAKIEIDRITINDQDQDGVVTNNSADHSTTGANQVNAGAFTNSSGFISTIQNTGNNVLIQNSTIINVSVEP